jgi:type IV pilus assembly protein PilM
MNFRDLLQTPAPDVAVEIDRTHVAAARVAWRGGQAVISAHASEPLPAGLVVPGLSALNVSDVPALSQCIARALSQLGGGRPSRVSLIVPDTVAKVSLLKLEQVPPRISDLREIVRWQVRKTAPFPVEQAVLSISEGARGAEGGNEFIVALSRDDVIHQYEQACLMAGVHAGLIDLSTFGVINSILASTAAPAGDWLLVHVTDTYLTLAVMRDSALLFFRNRGEEEGTLADLIHQTAMYYEDRLHGGGFARVLIAGAAQLPGGAESVRRGLEERLRIAVESVDPRGAAALQDRIGASAELLDVLAPLVGALMRERKAA